MGEQRLSKVTATAGPELVPQTFGTQLEWAILTYGGFLAAATQNFTETGEDTSLPYGDDTGNTGAFVGAEGTDVSDKARRIQRLPPNLGRARVNEQVHPGATQLLRRCFRQPRDGSRHMIGERLSAAL